MKKWRLFITVLVIAFLLLAGSLFGFLKPVKEAFWQVSRPISLVFRASFGRFPNFFGNLIHLQKILKQNQDLINENLDLQSQLVKLQEVNYENELLKKELKFAQTKPVDGDLVAAAIIGQSSGYLKIVTVDKGKVDRVEIGQAVVSEGFLVGVITDVRDRSADITLITDYNSLVPVILQNSRGTGLLRGGIDGLMIENVPLNVQPNNGENVVTSGLGGKIPEGLAVGKYQKITSKPGEIFQKMSVTSPVDFSRLEVLFIVEK